MGGSVVDGALVRRPVEGGAIEGRTFEGRTFERRAFEGRTFEGRAFEGRAVVGGAVVGGSVEGVDVGAMMVMMIGGGDGTPCIWTGKKRKEGWEKRGKDRQGQLG